MIPTTDDRELLALAYYMTPSPATAELHQQQQQPARWHHHLVLLSVHLPDRSTGTQPGKVRTPPPNTFVNDPFRRIGGRGGAGSSLCFWISLCSRVRVRSCVFARIAAGGGGGKAGGPASPLQRQLCCRCPRHTIVLRSRERRFSSFLPSTHSCKAGAHSGAVLVCRVWLVCACARAVW